MDVLNIPDNPANLNTNIFKEQFYEPAINFLSAYLTGFIFEVGTLL
jgi:hypothetical protein